VRVTGPGQARADELLSHAVMSLAVASGGISDRNEPLWMPERTLTSPPLPRQSGARLDALDVDGLSPEALAREQGQLMVADYLRDLVPDPVALPTVRLPLQLSRTPSLGASSSRRVSWGKGGRVSGGSAGVVVL
jgi:hypothetical protein